MKKSNISSETAETVKFYFSNYKSMGTTLIECSNRSPKHSEIYNAITLNKREIDRVHKNELYIATVSIKQKAVDRIKTALRFWFNATRISARMTSKTMTFETSISTIGPHNCYGTLR